MGSVVPFSPPPRVIATEVREQMASALARTREKYIDTEDFEREILRTAGELGLIGGAVPTSAGGGGRDPFTWGVTLEHLSYHFDELRISLLIGTYGLVASALSKLGRTELVGPLMRGEHLGAWAVSHVDPREIKCRVDAERTRVDGELRLVAGGVLAEFFIVTARGPDNKVGLYRVDRGDAGVSVTVPPMPVPGFADVKLDGVALTPERMILEDQAVEHTRAFQNRWNALLVAVVLGRMYAVTARCTKHLSKTALTTDAMSDPLHLRSTLGDVYESLESSRTVVYRALDRLRGEGADPKWDPQISIARHHVAEHSVSLGLRLMQLVGSDAYAAKLGVETYLHNVLSLTPVAGAHHELKLSLGYQAIAERATRKEEDLAWARETVRTYWNELPWWKRFAAKMTGKTPAILDEPPAPLDSLEGPKP